MGRQRNNPQMKGKEEVSQTMLKEKESSQLSDEFKELVIRKLNELKQNYKKLHVNDSKLTANYTNRKNEIETINKGHE